MKSTLVLSSVIILIVIGCKSSQSGQSIGQATSTFMSEWRINPTPNNFDSVGVIFAFDSKNNKVPLGVVELKTESKPVTIPMQFDSVTTDVGVMANFLSIKSNDSLAKAGLNDTSKIKSSFRISNGEITQYDLRTNLKEALKTAKQTVTDNQTIFDLQNRDVFMILNTVKSADVQLELQKEKNSDGSIFAKITKFFTVDAHRNTNKVGTNSISYNSPDSRVVLYKLHKINLTVVASQGNEPSKLIFKLAQ